MWQRLAPNTPGMQPQINRGSRTRVCNRTTTIVPLLEGHTSCTIFTPLFSPYLFCKRCGTYNKVVVMTANMLESRDLELVEIHAVVAAASVIAGVLALATGMIFARVE